MGYYLFDHTPARSQGRKRTQTFSGVVEVHTAESPPDVVGPDTGAENVARFIADRADPGCYHRLCDSDSIVPLLPFDWETWGDGTGLNPHVVHISAATQAHTWPKMTRAWRRATVRNMARAASEASDYLEALHGVRIPARFVTREQAGRRVEGFIAHGTSDPTRRTDPGKDFPWPMFFRMYKRMEARKVRTRGVRIKTTLALLRRADKVLAEAKGKGDRRESINAAQLAVKAAIESLESIDFVRVDTK